MSILFQNARFLRSAAPLTDCPADIGAEIAFCGRSNAGKSSAINTLTGQSKLARTSKTPGRTQLINFFQLSNQYRIVDLPGFGFARVPKKVKAEWHNNLDIYLRERVSLKGIVLLMDIRHPLKKFDSTLIQWCEATHTPLHILLTKADKMKRGAQRNILLSLRKTLPEEVSVQLFSATKNMGLDTLKARLSILFGEE